MAPDEMKGMMRRFYDEVMNEGRLELIDEFSTPDFVDHELPPELAGDGDSRTAVKTWIGMARAAMPDLRVDVHDIVCEGDRCAARITFSGTQTGELLGLEPTGRKATFDAIDYVRFVDGRFAEHWGVTDNLGAFAQLGVLPAAPGTMNAVHRAAHDAFNRRDWDGVVEHMASEGRFIDHARGLTMKTSEAFVDWAKEWVAAASDGQVEDRTYAESGSMSICRFHGRGTQDGPLGPFPASGNRFDLAYCEILHFDEDGLATGQEIFYDQMNLLIQLGHVPPPQG